MRRLAALSAPQGLIVPLFLLAAAGVAYRGHAWLEMGALVWLAPLADYDLEHRAIPHLAWVLVPGLLACGYAIWRGDWQLAVVVGLVVLASERRTVPRILQPVVFGLTLAACAGVVALNVRTTAVIGALAIAGFWLCFELGWWAGADALAAITLVLLWPNTLLLMALAAVHLALGLIQHREGRLRFPGALRPGELEAIGEPGLPALALTVVVYETLRVLGVAGGQVLG